MLKIRLQPTGKRKHRTFRFVVQESTKPRDAKVIEILGHYDPHEKPFKVEVDSKKVDAWKEKGASVSDSAASLIKRARSGKFDDLATKKKVSKHKKKKEEEDKESKEEKKKSSEKK